MTDVLNTAGGWWTLGGIALTALLAWVGTIIGKRLREPTRIETLWSRLDTQDKRIEDQDEKIRDLTDRLEETERQAAASVRVIRDLVNQWPLDNPPHLNAEDIDRLNPGTIPAHWRPAI